jgi:hypothetical protein
VPLHAGDELVLQIYSRSNSGNYPTFVFVPAEGRELRWEAGCCAAAPGSCFRSRLMSYCWQAVL